MTTPQSPPSEKPRTARIRRLKLPSRSLTAQGEPMIWLTGGALVVTIMMVVGLLFLVIYNGVRAFWPGPVHRVVAHDGRVLMGEVTRDETFKPESFFFDDLPEEIRDDARQARDDEGRLGRELVRTENFELTGVHFNWITEVEVKERSRPEWAVVLERTEDGRFYGKLKGFVRDGEKVADDPAKAWSLFEKHHPGVRERFYDKYDIERGEMAKVAHRLEEARLDIARARLDHGKEAPEVAAAEKRHAEMSIATQAEHDALVAKARKLDEESARYGLVLEISDGTEHTVPLARIVRGYVPNRLSLSGKMGIWWSRWKEFLVDDPRESNSEGGVYPAIFGTVLMTLVMTLLVVPLGVLAALYMREYAKAGPIISAVRIAVNNLAGVPSIVFGVFGLGFFCYIIGGNIDQVFFAEKLPNPTYGTGGLMWASLTLALLTLPVVIVASEEALSAVPNSLREGSYGCGASKWQTIRRIVLPRAMPGIMTGAVLAMARGAGEVAPLMLVGAVKLAPELPVDGVAPFVHPERSFMHLGFHIYDLGFQSQNSEAAKPIVFATTLLLIGIIFLLNIAAVWLRSRLRRKYMAGKF